MTRPHLVAAPSIRTDRVDGAPYGHHRTTPHHTHPDQPSSTLDEPGRDTARRGGRGGTIALAIPLVLVNAAAVYGQSAWAYEHLTRSMILAALFAAALESVGVYLAFEAHAALMAGDASARLRLGSYAIGGLVGALNYAHFSGRGFAPNALAITFGALSSISPWLWAIRSRSINRDRLRTLGLVDPRAVRFSVLRWLLHFGRTWRAFRAAVWAGETDPRAAVALAEPVDDVDEPDDGLERTAAVEAGRLLGTGQRVTRDTLAAAIRARGLTISSARAGQLVVQLREVLDQAA